MRHGKVTEVEALTTGVLPFERGISQTQDLRIKTGETRVNKFGIGLVLVLAIAAGGAYLVTTNANVGETGITTATVKETASDLATKAKDKAKDLAEKAKVAAVKTKEVAKEAAAKTAVVATDAANKISEKAAETVDKAKAKMAEVKKTVVADAGEKKAAEGGDGPAKLGPNLDKEWSEGKWEDEDGAPTYNIDGDGKVVKKVDWYTYSGWRRYHAECHVCHGPNGQGSTFAPALADSLKKLSYEKFLQVVSSGQQNIWGATNSIMPALGDNKNVMCYIDDIYVYLRARSDDAMPPGKLGAKQRSKKPLEAREFENECTEG